MRCAVFGCTSDNEGKPVRGNIKFFRFPKCKLKQQVWVLACGRRNKFSPDVARICSIHFRPEDFARNFQHELLNYCPKNYRALKSDAVPSIGLPKRKITILCDQRAERAANKGRKKCEERLAKLRATGAEPSTSAASHDELQTESDLAIEHVDVGSVSTSCEEQSDSNLEFLPESEEPPLPTTYPKPSSSSTLPPKDMKTYCRLCLKPVTKVQMICLGDFHDINYPSRTVQFKRNKILQTEMYLRMIRIVMPNFDHNLVFNPVMCNDCSTRLQMASDFVEQCMTTQKVIQEFKETHCPSEEMVSCEDVVYNKSLLQPDFEEGPTQPKQRKIVPKPSTSKSVAKSKAAVKPSPSVEQPNETQTFPPDEEFQHSSENIKIENMDGEEMEFEDKYEVTPEEICFIKQEPVEEAPRIKTDDAIHTNVPIKTEREYSLLTNSVVKSEPCSTSTSDYTIMTDPNNVKQFSAADVSCNLNSNNSSSLVHAVDLPSSSNIPISNYCPGIQNIAPEACINAVNPTAFSSVNSQFENSQNR
ncbi:unnamed protein product [Psylliodes chrysocephalus]|uniref:THAP-type domain-containing protein n=1 Tax=Psylliodes chrysocephalus TaxID=3402493 RepID=A0A9P0CMF0_9CUCU|nr:unnamed protein product [Psylliodes chrysocephala]